MHVVVDLNWLLHFVVLVFGFLFLVRNTASRVSEVGCINSCSVFSVGCKDSSGRMAAAGGGATEVSDSCAECGRVTTKHCAGCKMVKYCSEDCQRSHWKVEHKTKCKGTNSVISVYPFRKRKVSLVPAGGSLKILKQPNKMLFPYKEFVQFFNWEKPGSPPCGLLNCGNTCYANVVLQCLAYTQPLVAYLLEKGHKRECWMNKWCFLCEFQTHVERASQSHTPFAPMNILSRLPYIGGNLGYGEQEDAHEFMRFVIDTMQSVFLDEFGGEKAVHPSYQETTLVQHIFGGRLQSQVICTKCNNVSNQFENMMDLTVEIHGNAESLEECLDQFTAKEWLHGDNMYKCDVCNEHVTAWKRLAVQRAPNILTIALKRFQSGSFGKLNKKVIFPETLDLSFYISDLGDGNDVYKLYAVIVHVDMLNASFFGHYICYVKDFRGNWYRIDDSKVSGVDLDEVLSQGAYMLLYSRICARPSCLLPAVKKEENENVKTQTVGHSPTLPTECSSLSLYRCIPVTAGNLTSTNCSEVEVNRVEEPSSIKNAEDARRDVDVASCDASLPKEVASPVQPEAHNLGQGSLLSDVENLRWGDGTDTDKGPLRMPSEEFSAAKNCTFEKESTYDISSIRTGEVREANSANFTCMPEDMDWEPYDSVSDSTHDISYATTGEVREANSANSANSANLTCMPENMERERNSSASPDDSTKNAAKRANEESSGAKLKPIFCPGFLGETTKKSNEESSGAKLKPLFSRGFLGKQPRKEFGSVMPDDNTKDAAKKSNEESSGAKSKPVFARGFLVKETSKELVNQESKVSVELSERTPELQLNNNKIEVEKPYLLSENGNLLKDEKIVSEKGKVPTESAPRKILENQDSWSSNCMQRKNQN